MKDYFDATGGFLDRLIRIGSLVRVVVASLACFFVLLIVYKERTTVTLLYGAAAMFFFLLSVAYYVFHEKIVGRSQALFCMYVTDLLMALLAVQSTGTVNTVMAMLLVAPLFHWSFVFSPRVSLSGVLALSAIYGAIVSAEKNGLLPRSPFMPSNASGVMDAPLELAIVLVAVPVFSLTVVLVANFYKRAILETEEGLAESAHELRAALEEKKQIRDRLIRYQSLASVGQLVAGVAHELNNPIGSAHSLVQSAVETLEGVGGRVDEKDLACLADDLRFVNRQHLKARELVAGLLNMARQTTSYEDDVDLGQVADEAVLVLTNRYKYLDIGIEKRYAPDLPLFKGNEGQVGQVILNLVHNAIKAVEKKGGTILLETYRRGGRVCFACADDGPGVPAEDRQRIFEPFFTTKATGEGTGLGLFLCREIAARHGGSLYVEEHKCGGGARFVAEWPLEGSGNDECCLR